jgi:hypothetical protein
MIGNVTANKAVRAQKSPNSSRYPADRRLIRDLAGIQVDESGRPVMTRLEVGTIITVIGSSSRNGLVDVAVDGKIVAVFLVDLYERSQEIPSTRGFEKSPQQA